MSPTLLALATMDNSDPAYRAGYIAGRILVAIVVVALVIKLIRWMRK